MSRKPTGGLHAALVASLRVTGPMRDAAIAEMDRLLIGDDGSRATLADGLGISARQVRRLLDLYRSTSEPA